jgi:hypothetical protein
MLGQQPCSFGEVGESFVEADRYWTLRQHGGATYCGTNVRNGDRISTSTGEQIDMVGECRRSHGVRRDLSGGSVQIDWYSRIGMSETTRPSQWRRILTGVLPIIREPRFGRFANDSARTPA